MICCIVADRFQCYLCNGMQSSLEVCDQKIAKVSCDTHAKGADQCGIFSFVNGSTGIRVYGKSCVYKRFCQDKEHFCESVSTKLGIAKECNIVCCDEELCNFNSSSYKEEWKGNDDSEDCDWIDVGVSTRVSALLIGICALCATMALLK